MATFKGNSLNNILFGTSSNDLIEGFSGNDLLDGGAGNDVLLGGFGRDVLIGGAGADILDGGADKDDMRGGEGSDTYYVDHILDKVTESFNDTKGGIADTVISSVSFTLGFGLEVLELTGKQNINGIGNNARNTIIGNSGNNLIDGKGGNDFMSGGDGNDTYIVDHADDIAIETFQDARGGIDTVKSSVTFSNNRGLGIGIENLVLTGTANINGNGNSLHNTLTGNNGNNLLNGLDGDDVLLGGFGLDTLNGGNGNDFLDGGVGADTLRGGSGDDTYHVDDPGDFVIEGLTATLIGGRFVVNNAGVDTVVASIDYTLTSNVENLLLANNATAIRGSGNILDNHITGNNNDNTLEGFFGNDTLIGGNGNDLLDGGTGSDVMYGGSGDDTYIVDHADDVASESSPTTFNSVIVIPPPNTGQIVVADGGIDTVMASVSHTLSSGIETLLLTEPAIDTAGSGLLNSDAGRHTDGTGNNLANTLIGNSGDNSLFGLGNDDVLDGGLGNDRLFGGEGKDTLIGGAGVDRLNGGDSADSFVFRAITDSGVGGLKRDVIEDFDALEGDKIDLRLLDANNNLADGIQPWSLTPSLVGLTGETGQMSFNTSSNTLQFDTNGDAVADMEIEILGVDGISGSDFLLG